MDPVLRAARELQSEIVAWRRSLHRIPELANQEERTSGLVADALTELGLEVTEGVAGTGVVAHLPGTATGRGVALRADMDGLPLQEQTGLDFASLHEGRMHACGHDAHMAMLLGAARLLVDRRDSLSGHVTFLFQPAEEQGGLGGAQPLIEAGVLQAPPVDFVFGLHVWPFLESGRLGFHPGTLMASSDTFQVTVRGKGGHGAKPHVAVDPIVAAAHLILALQTLASREMDPLEPFVLTVGRVEAGTTNNVIPGEAVLEGTLRTMREATRASLRDRLERVIQGVTTAYRTEYSLDFTEGYPPTSNDPAVTRRAAEVLAGVFGSDDVLEIPPTMGAEDFSRYLQVVPGSFFFLGTRNEAKGLTASIHSPHFQVDEDVLPLGAAALARLALTFTGSVAE